MNLVELINDADGGLWYTHLPDKTTVTVDVSHHETEDLVTIRRYTDLAVAKEKLMEGLCIDSQRYGYFTEVDVLFLGDILEIGSVVFHDTVKRGKGYQTGKAWIRHYQRQLK